MPAGAVLINLPLPLRGPWGQEAFHFSPGTWQMLNGCPVTEGLVPWVAASGRCHSKGQTRSRQTQRQGGPDGPLDWDSSARGQKGLDEPPAPCSPSAKASNTDFVRTQRQWPGQGLEAGAANTRKDPSRRHWTRPSRDPTARAHAPRKRPSHLVQ